MSRIAGVEEHIFSDAPKSLVYDKVQFPGMQVSLKSSLSAGSNCLRGAGGKAIQPALNTTTSPPDIKRRLMYNLRGGHSFT
jgi:hypothetical protein